MSPSPSPRPRTIGRHFALRFSQYRRIEIASLAIALSSLVAFSPSANAQEAAPAAAPAADPAAAPAAAAASDPASVRRSSDPSADRNLLLPTAETLPKGAVTFNSYELLFAGLSYGISDRLELSATTLLPIVSDIPFLLTTSLKWNFYRTGQGLLSFMPSATVIRDNGVTVGGIGLTLIGDRILDQAGRFALTGGFMSQFVFGGASDDVDFADGALMVLWTGLSARFHEHVKFLGELILPGGYTWVEGGQFELLEEALLFGYGVRFFGKTLAVDLSFLRPIHPDVDTGNLVMGVPWVAFSAQF